MSLKTKTAKEQLSLQTSAEETNHSNKPLILYNALEGTPFTHVEQDKVGHYLVMGNYRMSPAMETKEECLNYLEDNKWSIIGVMIAAHIDFNNNQQQNKN